MESNYKKSIKSFFLDYLIIISIILAALIFAQDSESQVITRADIIKSGNLSKYWIVPTVSMGTIATTSGTENFYNKSIFDSTLFNVGISSATVNSFALSSGTIFNTAITSASIQTFSGVSFTLVSGAITTFHGTDFSLTSGTIRSFSASLGLLTNFTGSSFTLTTGSVSGVSIFNSNISSASVTNGLWTGGTISGAAIVGLTLNDAILSGTTTVSGTLISRFIDLGNASGTIQTYHRFVNVGNTTANMTYTLPSAVGVAGETHTITRNVSTATTQSIITSSSGSLCNVGSIKLSGLNDNITFYSDGTNWIGDKCFRTLAFSTNTGCTAITNLVGNPAASASSAGAGQCSVALYSGILSGTPACSVLAGANGANNGEQAVGAVTMSASTIAWYQSQPGVGANNRPAFVICTGPR